MQNIIVADNQDITRAGMVYVLSKMKGISCDIAGSKAELIRLLSGCPEAIVILDYTLLTSPASPISLLSDSVSHCHISSCGAKS